MSNAKRAPVGTNSIFNQPTIEGIASIKTKKRLKDGRVLMPFSVPLAARAQLQIMAIENNTSQQELLTKALNDFFQRHGKEPIA